MKKFGMSRRDFIGLGSTLAIGVSAGSLMGCSPKAREDSPNDSASHTEQASFLVAPAAISDGDIAESHEYDIVVVGAGNAGIPAAISAKKNGAHVCVVEKNERPNSQGSEASGIDLDKSDEAAIQHLIDLHLAANNYRPKRDVVETWAKRSGEALHFLRDYSASSTNPLIYGQDESDPVVYPGTNLKATLFWLVPTEGSYTAGQTALAEHAAADGIDFYFSTPAVQLVQNDEGTITGVICQNQDNKYLKFTASKGVILAAGDYQNDQEMLNYYLPDIASCEAGQQGKTGDGIKMALWAGGVMEPVGHTKMSHSYGKGPMGDEPFLSLNMKGKRFCSENMPLFQKQTFFRFGDGSAKFIQVFDSSYEQQVTEWGGKPTKVADLDKYNPESAIYNKKGKLYKSDSLEDLGKKCNVENVEAFVESVQRYNEFASKGLDEEFGKPPQYLKPISTPPFYGVFRSCGLTAITSGLLTDSHQRVLGKDGNPIKGLFAAGNTAGGFFGAIDYPLRTIEGLSIGKAMTGGYVAAENAMKSE